MVLTLFFLVFPPLFPPITSALSSSCYFSTLITNPKTNFNPASTQKKPVLLSLSDILF